MTGWLAPLLFCASILLLGWTFYTIYVKGMKTRLTVIVAWLSLAFMVGFWTWHLIRGVW